MRAVWVAAGKKTKGSWEDILGQAPITDDFFMAVAVLNQSIGGNRLLADGLGPNALARFNDDVIAQAGVRSLIVLEGINDIGVLGGTERPRRPNTINWSTTSSARTRKLSNCSHPRYQGGGLYDPAVRGLEFLSSGTGKRSGPPGGQPMDSTPGHFDVVIDFDQVMRDPASPEHLLTKFDSGDRLHPSPAGYAAMAANATRECSKCRDSSVRNERVVIIELHHGGEAESKSWDTLR